MNKIDPHSLPKILYQKEGDVGIYFLFNEDVLIYIGKSDKSILSRLGSHCKDKIFTHYAYLPLPDLTSLELAEVEQRLIFEHQPTLNKQIIDFDNKKPYKKKEKVISPEKQKELDYFEEWLEAEHKRRTYNNSEMNRRNELKWKFENGEITQEEFFKNW